MSLECALINFKTNITPLFHFYIAPLTNSINTTRTHVLYECLRIITPLFTTMLPKTNCNVALPLFPLLFG